MRMTSKFYIFKINISHEIGFSIFQQCYLTKKWDARSRGGGQLFIEKENEGRKLKENRKSEIQE